MEEMLEVMKKQLKMQKLISGLLAVMLVILLIAGGFFVNRMSQMTAAMSEAADKLQQVDVDGINDAIGTTQEMLESAGELSDAVDSVTLKVKEFNDWMSGLFGNWQALIKTNRRGEIAEQGYRAPAGDCAGGRADVHGGFDAVDLCGDAVVIARPARNGVHGYLRDVRSCRGERGGDGDVDAARKGCDRLLGAAGKDSRLFGIG